MQNAKNLMKTQKIKELINFYEENTDRVNTPFKKLVPEVFKTIEEYKKFLHEFCIEYSSKRVKKSVNQSHLIGIYIGYLDILDEVINSLFERVYENFTIYYPEASLELQDLESFTKLTKLDRKTISKLTKVPEQSMGLELSNEDLTVLQDSILELKGLVEQKKSIEKRTEELTMEIAENTSKVAGTIVTAKLINAAGSLKKLMMMPSSTIQVIGAEKALFRHLKGKAKSPKHGIIFQSEYVSGTVPAHRGKMARALASKISIAAKVDYFKGEQVWEKLRQDLDDKKNGLKG